MQSSFLGSSNGLRAQRAFAPSRVSVAAPTVVAHYGGKANLGGGKAWERTKVNDNGKPVKFDMHIKKGDIVQVCCLCMVCWVWMYGELQQLDVKLWCRCSSPNVAEGRSRGSKDDHQLLLAA
jgi:hypothetical protein